MLTVSMSRLLGTLPHLSLKNVARLQKVLREERPVKFIHLLKCYLIDTAYQYSTAVSTRAALTMWYRGLRPNESTAEWRLDPATNTWYVLFLCYSYLCSNMYFSPGMGFLLDHVMSPNLWWVLRRPRPNLEKCRLLRAPCHWMICIASMIIVSTHPSRWLKSGQA